MDIAVFSDIHGNYIALKRCLEYSLSQGIDTFIFLGDYIGELAYPKRTMQILYDMSERYTCYFIRGNKEDYWLNYRTGGEVGWDDKNSASGSLLYAYNLLTPRDMDFFAQLQPVREITIGKMPTITICHGSPYRTNELILSKDARAIEIMNSTNTSILLCGHTHRQSKFVHNESCILNPGAVGMSLCAGGKTQFMLLHGNNGKWSEEMISLEYDIDTVIKELYEAKLDKHAPYWCLVSEHILRGGNAHHGKVLVRAMELCSEETGKCEWPDIPEKYWATAVEELIHTDVIVLT